MDEEKSTNNTYLKVELPGIENSTNFKRFEIKYREKESKEDAKLILNSLENEQLLFSLIPLAFNEDLKGEIKTFSLFAEKEGS